MKHNLVTLSLLILLLQVSNAFDIINKVKWYDILDAIDKLNEDGYDPNIDEQDDHLYLVQIDSIIPLPYFDIDLSREIDGVSKMGIIRNEVPILDINEEDIELANQFQKSPHQT